MENQSILPGKKKINFCLYARKSTDRDELQALSIDSQLKEMLAVVDRDGLNGSQEQKVLVHRPRHLTAHSIRFSEPTVLNNLLHGRPNVLPTPLLFESLQKQNTSSCHPTKVEYQELVLHREQC